MSSDEPIQENQDAMTLKNLRVTSLAVRVVIEGSLPDGNPIERLLGLFDKDIGGVEGVGRWLQLVGATFMGCHDEEGIDVGAWTLGRDLMEAGSILHPSYDFIGVGLGYCELMLGRHLDAIPRLERYLELHPDDPMASACLAACEQQAGRNKEAIERARRVLASADVSPEVRELATQAVEFAESEGD